MPSALEAVAARVAAAAATFEQHPLSAADVEERHNYDTLHDIAAQVFLCLGPEYAAERKQWTTKRSEAASPTAACAWKDAYRPMMNIISACTRMLLVPETCKELAPLPVPHPSLPRPAAATLDVEAAARHPHLLHTLLPTTIQPPMPHTCQPPAMGSPVRSVEAYARAAGALSSENSSESGYAVDRGGARLEDPLPPTTTAAAASTTAAPSSAAACVSYTRYAALLLRFLTQLLQSCTKLAATATATAASTGTRPAAEDDDSGVHQRLCGLCLLALSSWACYAPWSTPDTATAAAHALQALAASPYAQAVLDTGSSGGGGGRREDDRVSALAAATADVWLPQLQAATATAAAAGASPWLPYSLPYLASRLRFPHMTAPRAEALLRLAVTVAKAARVTPVWAAAATACEVLTATVPTVLQSPKCKQYVVELLRDADALQHPLLAHVVGYCKALAVAAVLGRFDPMPLLRAATGAATMAALTDASSVPGGLYATACDTAMSEVVRGLKLAPNAHLQYGQLCSLSLLIAQAGPGLAVHLTSLLSLLVRTTVDTSDARCAAASLHCLRLAVAVCPLRFTLTAAEEAEIVKEEEDEAEETVESGVEALPGILQSSGVEAPAPAAIASATAARVAALAAAADRHSRLEACDHVIAAAVQCALQVQQSMYILPQMDEHGQLAWKIGGLGRSVSVSGGGAGEGQAQDGQAGALLLTYVHAALAQLRGVAPARLDNAIAAMCDAEPSMRAPLAAALQ